MNSSIFLGKYFVLQKDVVFDIYKDLGFAIIGCSSVDNSPFWNQAFIREPISDIQLQQIANIMDGFKRVPTIYFEKNNKMSSFINHLESRGYKKKFEDSWLSYIEKSVSEEGFEKVRKVENENMLEIFLQTLEECFQNNDPQNPYGKLPTEYIHLTKELWYKHNQSNRLEYFLVYKGEKPVAVSTLNSYRPMGYISNVGSLKTVRGEGYGKLATLYCVAQSMKYGNTIHTLATEQGDYPNNFYQRIGFETKSVAPAYVFSKT